MLDYTSPNRQRRCRQIDSGQGVFACLDALPKKPGKGLAMSGKHSKVNERYPPNPSGKGTEPPSGGSCVSSRNRVYVYVDGFNLYYRVLKKRPELKWLDLGALFSKLTKSSDKIFGIKYFTARVSSRPGDPGQPMRQDVYLKALKASIPDLEIIYGQFRSRPAMAKKACSSGYVRILKTEEKGSDVNLATHMLQDAWLDKYDTALLVSNDSDMASALDFITSPPLDKTVGLLTPDEKRISKELTKYALFVKAIRPTLLSKCQLPDIIPGTGIHRPDAWR